MLVETQPGSGRFRTKANGEPMPPAPWELIEGGEAISIDQGAFANRGHLDFEPGFDPSGAADLR